MKFKVAQAKQPVITKWHNFIHIYKLENDFFVKLTKLNTQHVIKIICHFNTNFLKK